MSHQSGIPRICCALLYFLSSAVFAQGAAPSDYVNVPGWGLVHPSCVYEVPTGAAIIDGHAYVNGALVLAPPPCEHPVIPPGTTPASKIFTIKFPTNTPGLGLWWNYLVTNWTVPSQPQRNDGQFFALWPALQSASPAPGTGLAVFQPVLMWGQQGYAGYAMANFYCDNNLNCYHDQYQFVNPGDTITGWVLIDTNYACNASSLGQGCFFDVIYTSTGGATSHLLVNSPFPVTQAIGGDLEFANVPYCNDLPASGSTVFTTTLLTQPSTTNSFVYYPINPNWFGTVHPGGPSCFYGWTDSGSKGEVFQVVY
jgi:hypothetical protein